MQNDNEGKKDEGKETGGNISDFVQRNRTVIFVFLGAIVFLFVGAVVFLSLKDFLQKKAIAEVEELNQKFTELWQGPDEEASAELQELLDEIEAFAKSKSGFAAGRAWSIIAHVYSEKKEWPQAEEAWVNAARAASKTYMGATAYFNAAAAAEEQGNLERAIELLGLCVSHSFAFPAAPRAQFSIGRLNEQLDNIPAALEAYRAVLVKWPDITVWVNLAHSRIAALDSR